MIPVGLEVINLGRAMVKKALTLPSVRTGNMVTAIVTQSRPSLESFWSDKMTLSSISDKTNKDKQQRCRGFRGWRSMLSDDAILKDDFFQLQGKVDVKEYGLTYLSFILVIYD